MPRRTLSLLLVLLSLNFSPLLLYAGIGVNPTVTEISLYPGKIRTGAFTVLNDGDKATEVKVELEDWGRKEGGVEVTSWLRIKPLKFELGPGETRKVKYKIEVPKGAKGELMAMVFFGSIVPQGGGVGIQTRFGVSIYVTIKGTEVVEASIEKLNASRYGSESSENSGINFGVTVENRGNVHVRPRGKVTVEDRDGNTVMEVDILYGFPVFPQAKRTFPAIWKGGVLPPGEYKAEATMSYGELYGLKGKICSYETLFSVNEEGEISIEGREND